MKIGACRPRHAWALPGLFRIMRTHIQCRDKIHFLQLCIKCSVAKSCPGTHTALQVPMLMNDVTSQCNFPLSLVRTPLQHSKRKGCPMNIVQHFCTSPVEFGISAVQSDWLMWELSHVYWASLLQALSFTHHSSLQTYFVLSTSSNLLKPSKRLQRLGLLRESIATASP